ncbi:MAG TPA: hypothetical protein VLC55_00155 [Burkholderiales bacterium]|nr:hypothetical protein [Burkholderiales bacterium]
MPTSGKRLGLSFEAAPPAAPHPNRTDIACFVGCVARRARALRAGLQPLPPVLARWLEDSGWRVIAGRETASLQADIGGATALRDSLLVPIDAALDTLEATPVPAQEKERRRNLLLAERERMVDFWRGLKPVAVDALLAGCRSLAPLSRGLLEDLAGRGFVPGGLLGSDPVAAWQRVQQLLNLPVALESFEQFDALFAWEARPVLDRPEIEPGDPLVVTPLGAAVRAFFAEGGRRCYVIRSGDPVPLFASAARRFAALAGAGGDRPRTPDAMDAIGRVPAVPGIRPQTRRDLLASVTTEFESPPGNGSLWLGIEHVYGLPEVSFLCLPELVDACAQDIPTQVPPAEKAAVEDRFRECAEPAAPRPEPVGRRLPPPALNSLGLDVWRMCLMHALRLLANDERASNRRDIQLLASLPLAGEGRDMPPPDDWIAWMDASRWFVETVRRAPPAQPGDESLPRDMKIPPLIEARLQFAYPWLRTRDSDDCQGGAEAPEGTLAGTLARSALAQGAFRLAAHQPVTRAVDMVPALDLSRATQAAVSTPAGELTLAERVCLIAPSPRGFELLTDVTCAGEILLRPGSVRRLLNVVTRAARALGEELAFESSGEALWAQVRARLSDLGRLLLSAGALSGDAARAFSVRCGRDTMTQADIDAGRLIAEIELVPAQPVTRIVVSLALRDSQPVTSVRRAA